MENAANRVIEEAEIMFHSLPHGDASNLLDALTSYLDTIKDSDCIRKDVVSAIGCVLNCYHRNIKFISMENILKLEKVECLIEQFHEIDL